MGDFLLTRLVQQHLTNASHAPPRPGWCTQRSAAPAYRAARAAAAPFAQDDVAVIVAGCVSHYETSNSLQGHKSSVEYFEGVQNWYNANIRVEPCQRSANEIDARADVEEYDPGLYEVLAAVLPAEPSHQDCYYCEE